MPNYADEKLRKVTLNLYDRDVAYLQDHFPSNYTEKIRRIVREWTTEYRRDLDGSD